jgi:HAAS domain-containing protein
VTTETTLHPLAERYLKDLRRRARILPRGRRDELLADIQAHLSETAPAGSGEADVRTALDRLGDPEEIVAAEAGAEPAPGRRGWLEWGAIVLLLIGGIVIPVVGWIVGALLLWVSRSWTLRDKVWGTLILPGGLLPAAWLVVADVSIESCHSGPHGQVCTGAPTTTQQTINIAFFVGAVVLPFITAVYLARRAQRPVGAR